MVEAVADQVMVVGGSPGVPRNASASRHRGSGLRGAVVHGEYEDALHTVKYVPGMGVGLGPIGKVLHLACVTRSNPLGEPTEAIRGYRRTYAGRLKAELVGSLLQLIGQLIGAWDH